MQKREISFVNLPKTSHFMHFQSVRQKKWNIHNKTNEYRWHFRSKPHQTTSLTVANTRLTAPLTRRGKTKFATVKWYNLCLQIIQSQKCYPLNNVAPEKLYWASIMLLKGHRHDWGQCLFTKIIWHEILIEFLQKVIQKCTNHFGKDWAINKAEITHKSLYL